MSQRGLGFYNRTLFGEKGLLERDGIHPNGMDVSSPSGWPAWWGELQTTNNKGVNNNHRQVKINGHGWKASGERGQLQGRFQIDKRRYKRVYHNCIYIISHSLANKQEKPESLMLNNLMISSCTTLSQARRLSFPAPVTGPRTPDLETFILL